MTTAEPPSPPPLPDVLSGPRLDLVLVPVETLLARAASDGPVPLGYTDPDDVLSPDDSPLLFRVAQVRADPSVNPWLIRIAVLRETGEVVGLANFHGPPDGAGMVEIGYRVRPVHRRRGYAREMALTLWRAAAARPDVRVLRATVSPGNTASIRLIEGAGLRHVGEQDDPEDGLELVYEIGAQEFLAHHP